MDMLACVDKNMGIGYKGKLLFNISEDKRFFRNHTINGVVIMGRKTFESLPERKPLGDRVNIVISNSLSDDIGGVFVVRSVEDAISKAKEFDFSVFMSNTHIIGGESIYKEFLKYADSIYLTTVDKRKESDKKFPFFDTGENWSKISTLFEGISGGTHYKCELYRNHQNMIHRNF